MKKSTMMIVVLIMLSALCGTAFGNEEGEKPSVKVTGLAFGDFFWDIDSHDPDYRNQFGFWIRRIFLGVDADLTHGFTSRVQLEMNQADAFGTPASNGNMVPYIRDVWLKYSFAGQNATFGIQPPPPISLVESWWGFRYVEKTLADLQKAESTRDLGVAMDGRIDSEGMFRYKLMYGNGSGTAAEENLAKSVYGAIQAYPTDGMVVELYGKYAGMDGSGTWTTAAQAFFGYRTDVFSLGAQWYMNFQDGGNSWMAGSLFGNVALAEKWTLFLRGDIMPDGTFGTGIPYLAMNDAAGSLMLLILGVDYNPWGTIHLAPNFEYVFNIDGAPFESEAVLRLTAYWKF